MEQQAGAGTPLGLFALCDYDGFLLAGLNQTSAETAKQRQEMLNSLKKGDR